MVEEFWLVIIDRRCNKFEVLEYPSCDDGELSKDVCDMQGVGMTVNGQPLSVKLYNSRENVIKANEDIGLSHEEGLYSRLCSEYKEKQNR